MSLACWYQITAPVLCVEANDTDIWTRLTQDRVAMWAEIDRCLAVTVDVHREVMVDAPGICCIMINLHCWQGW